MNRDVVRQTYQSNLRKKVTDLRRTHRRDILVTADSHEKWKLITANYRKRKRTRTKTRTKTTRTRTRTRRKREMTRIRTKKKQNIKKKERKKEEK